MKYFVNKYEKIDHNGNRFVDGDEITGLSAEEAERLVRLGVITATETQEEEKEDPKPKTKAKKDDA